MFARTEELLVCVAGTAFSVLRAHEFLPGVLCRRTMLFVCVFLRLMLCFVFTSSVFLSHSGFTNVTTSSQSESSHLRISVPPSQNKFSEQTVGLEPTLSSRQNRSSYRLTGVAISIPTAPTFRRLVGDSGLTGVVHTSPLLGKSEPGACRPRCEHTSFLCAFQYS